MLTHVVASSASSVVAISSSQQESSSTTTVNSIATTAQLTSVTDTTASTVLKSGRKKARKTNPGILQQALEDDCEIVINAPTTGNAKRKRSRKQKINTLSDTTDSLVSNSAAKVPTKKRQKKEKVVALAPSKKTDKYIASDCGSASPLVEPPSSSSVSHEPTRDIDFAKLIDRKLCFKLFGDVSRNIAAISPSEVVVAVETTTEPGSLNEINRENALNKPNCGNLFSLYKTSPHFLPVTGTLYARSEPLARILPFSQLEDYTLNQLLNTKTNTFRFCGPRFERRLLDPPYEDGEKNKTHNEYRNADLIIKHPLLSFYHRKLISLKFVVTKRVPINDSVFAVVKARIVQLRRTTDLKNIEIFVDECDIDEKALDVNAMNQQNIQPVIQTSSGLVPVITNTNSSYQPTYHHHHQPQQYHYIHYQYQEPTTQVSLDDSTFRIANGFSINNNNNNNNNVPVIRSTDFPRSTFLTENGTRILILNHQSSLSAVQHSSYPGQIQQQQIEQEVPLISQLATERQASFGFQFPSELQQQQQKQYFSLPSKEEQTICRQIVDSLQPPSLPGSSTVPIRLIQPHLSSGTSVETTTTSSPFSSQQLQHQIQYQAQPKSQPNYNSSLQQQISSLVQVQQLSQNLIPGHVNEGQSLQYTLHAGHQELVQEQLQIQPPLQQITQQSFATHPNPVDSQSLCVPVQNFQHCPPPLSVQFPQQAHSATLPSNPLVKQKGVKQPKRSSKKPKVAAAAAVPLPQQISSVPVPTTLSEQQLQQLQLWEKSGTTAYEHKDRALTQVTQPFLPIEGLQGSHPSSVTAYTPPSSRNCLPVSRSPKTVLVKAPKSQDLIVSSSSSSSSTPVAALSSGTTSSPGSKVFTVVQSNITKTVESHTAVCDNRPAKKEGYLAVCPRCGLCSPSLLRCVRCKAEFPEDVRLVKDGFKVSKTEAVVVVVKSDTPSAEDIASEKAGGPSVSNNIIKTCSPLATTAQKIGANSGGRKIILVNKPAILGVVAKAAAGTVHIAVQEDGGSSVTILNNCIKSASKTNLKPIPKKRAPPRKRQQELITLSSDDEGSDSQSSVSVDQEKTKEESCASAPNNMAKKTGIAINLSADDACNPSKRRKREDTEVRTPEQIYGEISKRMAEPGCKFKYAMVLCRSVRIGSYKVTSSDTGFDIPVTFTELGVKFDIPHANFKHKTMKMCIPLNVILDMTAHLHKKLPAIFISTGPKYARSVRETLGLDGSPESESSNFFCPQNGRQTQKKITFVAVDIAEPDVGVMKSIYNEILNEIDYNTANALLMSVTPDTYRSSISFTDEPPGSPPTPKIISTSSAGTIEQKLCSTSTTNAVSNDTKAPPSAGGSSAVTHQDNGSAVLFYQGKNNVKVPICPNDISCLGYSQFLNDQIIDFWLAVIQTEILSDDDKARTFVFDSFFYSKLTEKVKKRTPDEGSMTAGERRHARVKKRTKNVDIFEKDFLIVPINENYHWFIAIICFPGLQGYHDYDSLEPLVNYKRTKTSKPKTASVNKPIISSQPKSESTASYSSRDEAPEDPDEMESQMSTELEEDCLSPSGSKVETDNNHKRTEAGGVLKRSSEFGHRIKHPCILIFDSLAGDARGRVFSTLREYLKIEYKTKKEADRLFDKTTIPGCMPKVPQQPNFSDCGLFMLQYVESFFTCPILNYDTMQINLKNWFQTSIAENKRREIYDFILKKVEQLYPHNLGRIPSVNFEAGDDDILVPEPEGASLHTEEDSDDLFEPAPTRAKTRRKNSDSDDHTYAKGNSASTSTCDSNKE